MKNIAYKILASVVFIISLIAIIVWQFVLSDVVNYYLVSVFVLLLSMIPFFLSFEIKSITTKELAVMASLIALAVISRVAFYLIPQVKPIAAVVIVSAICLGPQRGYIIGALSAFVSNFIFGQGIWTPFQMVALGLVGFVSALIFHNRKINRYLVSIVGFLLVFVLYGAIVDASTILMQLGQDINIKAVLTIYSAGVPFSFVFALTTAVVLFAFGPAFVRKVDRLNTKFGLYTGGHTNE